ncbi:hypothetical protein OSTOST_00516 [Ostertagia ostertagi]
MPERSQEHPREHSSTQSTASDVVRPYVLPQRTVDAPSLSSHYTQHHSVVQQEPFLLQGEPQVVLQDLDPDECNYLELVRALKRRYDRPYKTRATLHKQLQQLPAARNNGQDLRNTWFRISGILHCLRRYEDFRTYKVKLTHLANTAAAQKRAKTVHICKIYSTVDIVISSYSVTNVKHETFVQIDR